MTSQFVFVDESKARDYLLVAAVVLPAGIHGARRTMRGLLLPGQPRLHMKKESDARRRRILAAIADLGPRVDIYRAGAGASTDLVRRRRCLEALVAELANDALFTTLCLERDETLVSRDRQHLIQATRAHDCSDRIAYHHEAATSEPLLALPDTVAWAWAKGGEWRRRCEPLNARVTDV